MAPRTLLPLLLAGFAAVGCVILMLVATRRAAAPAEIPAGSAQTVQAATPEPSSSAATAADEAATADRSLADPVEDGAVSAPAADRAREVVAEARTSGHQVVLAEVVSVTARRQWRRKDSVEHVKLCAFTERMRAGSRRGELRYHVLHLLHDPTHSRRRLGVAMPIGTLKVGQVRELVVEGVSLDMPVKTSEHARLLYAGPLLDAPYGEALAAMPKRLFGPLSRGASVFTGSIVARSSRPTEPARRRLGLGATIDVVEVVVSAVAHNEHRFAPGVRLRIDLLRPPRYTLGLRDLAINMPSSDLDFESMTAGAELWFAVDNIWGKPAVLDAVDI